MMPSCLSILFRALRIEWRETKRTLFPTTPIETGLFLFFFLLYGCIGYRMLFHTICLFIVEWFIMGDICKGEQFFVAGTVAIYMQRLGGEIRI